MLLKGFKYLCLAYLFDMRASVVELISQMWFNGMKDMLSIKPARSVLHAELKADILSPL